MEMCFIFSLFAAVAMALVVAALRGMAH